jgi:hypothetical protein
VRHRQALPDQRHELLLAEVLAPFRQAHERQRPAVEPEDKPNCGDLASSRTRNGEYT